MIRVLVVDDSASMRGLIKAMLATDAAIAVVGEAADPIEARAAMKALNPDVITLDVEMPNMNGIDFLDKIMRLRPTPVVMVSTLTHRGCETALQALEIGAVDCVGKPLGAIGDFDGLVAKVKAAAGARVRSRSDALAEAGPAHPARPDFQSNGKLIAIGSSTGGVEALIQLLSALPERCPPTVITQHMPATFTKTFAARLDKLCAPRVAEAHDGAILSPGCIYLAPGGLAHLRVSGPDAAHLRCQLSPSDPVNGHRPSVDVLFASVAKSAGKEAIGVILTGMGRDGAAGLLAIREAGGHTLGQDEATSVVYGMPRAAYELGAVERQLPLGRLSAHILNLADAGREKVH